VTVVANFPVTRRDYLSIRLTDSDGVSRRRAARRDGGHFREVAFFSNKSDPTVAEISNFRPRIAVIG
jgi:hypothetical protein